MDRSSAAVLTTFIVILIIVICFVIAKLSPVVGYGILLLWLLVFAIYLWIQIRGKVEKKLIETEGHLNTMMNPEIYRHKYDYLCPACLFQTNENTGLCPRCGRRELIETYKHPLDKGKSRFEDEDEENKHIPL